MGFMKREEYSGAYWEIDTSHGTWFLPANDIGTPDAWERYAGPDASGMIGEPDDECDREDWDSIRSFFGDYVEGGPDSIDGIELHSTGTLYRLSAPGYADCTEWTTDPDSPEFDDDEPTEPEDDDGTLRPCGPLGSMTSASFMGKCLGEFRTDDDAENAIRRAGNAAGFYPNVWRISDHGNAHLIEDWHW